MTFTQLILRCYQSYFPRYMPNFLQKKPYFKQNFEIILSYSKKYGKLLINNLFDYIIYVFAYLFIQCGLQFIHNQNLAISTPEKIVHVKKRFTESKTKVLHIE